MLIDDNSLPLPWTAKRGADPEELAGTWKLKIEGPNGNPIESTLKLSADGEILKGTYTGRFGEQPAAELKLDGNQLSWHIAATRDGRNSRASIKRSSRGTRSKGNLDFELDDNKGTMEFTGERDRAKADSGKPGEKSSSTAAPKSRAIVSLKGRDEILTVHYVGTRKVTFSVFSRQGKPIAKDISLKTLQASYPAIYKAYRTSYADAWATTD